MAVARRFDGVEGGIIDIELRVDAPDLGKEIAVQRFELCRHGDILPAGMLRLTQAGRNAAASQCASACASLGSPWPMRARSMIHAGSSASVHANATTRKASRNPSV